MSRLSRHFGRSSRICFPGSVLLFDELTWPGAPGEAIAFKETFKDVNYRVEKCELYPSKSIVIVQ